MLKKNQPQSSLRNTVNIVLPLCTLWLKFTSNKVRIMHFLKEPEL